MRVRYPKIEMVKVVGLSSLRLDGLVSLCCFIGLTETLLKSILSYYSNNCVL